MVIPRITEPTRPESFHQLPPFKDTRYWQSMARAVKLIRPNMIEIPQYTDQRVRVVGFCAGVFLMLILVFNFLVSVGSWSSWVEKMAEGYDYGYDYFFDVEEKARESYRKSWSSVLEGHTTEDEFVDIQVNSQRHSNRPLRRDSIYLLFGFIALVLFGLALFYPKSCPMRFDRNREIAYTWHKGTFYIADIGPFLDGLHTGIESALEYSAIAAYHEDKTTGPVGIRLFDGRQRGGKRDRKTYYNFRIGPYPVAHTHQNVDIILFIQAFMSKYLYSAQRLPEPWNDQWLNKFDHGGFFIQDTLRRLGEKTLGRKHRFDEAKTEAAIMEYLTHPSTRLRGCPLGHG